MTNHISEELPRLLTGDATRDVVMAAAEHLRSCPDCQQELVSAVVAHASLTSAHRFAPEIVASDTPSIVGSGSEPARHAADASGDDDAELTELPNMTSMFAQIREEAEAKPARAHQRHRLLAVAAAAVVLVGGGAAVYSAEHGSSTSSTNQVALAAYDAGGNPASATLRGNKVSVNATALPRLSASHVYEVWLTDKKRENMVAIGFINKNNKAQLTVSQQIKLSSYTDIEVSLQPVGHSSYSGTSVLRGSYG